VDRKLSRLTSTKIARLCQINPYVPPFTIERGDELDEEAVELVESTGYKIIDIRVKGQEDYNAVVRCYQDDYLAQLVDHEGREIVFVPLSEVGHTSREVGFSLGHRLGVIRETEEGPVYEAFPMRGGEPEQVYYFEDWDAVRELLGESGVQCVIALDA
jgi:hypothetical protein